MNIEQSSNTCQLNGLGSDAAEKALVTPEDLPSAAGGNPAVFCPDTPVRQLFEEWVKRRAPIAEFTRNENGEYIVLGMHDEYMAFVAGWASCEIALTANVEGQALPQGVACTDGLCGNGSEVGADDTAEDLSKCPGCGGPADNGHDRCYPPTAYLCSKCSELHNGGVEGAARLCAQLPSNEMLGAERPRKN